MMNARISLISLLVRASLLAGSMVAQASPVLSLPPLRSDSEGSGVEKESLRQGYEALRAAQHDKAEKAFREANRLNPLAPEPMLGLAMAAQGLGKTELALQAYQSAAMLSPTDPMPSALRGQYLEQLKRPAQAEQAYRDALRVSKDHPGVMNNLAFLLATQKLRLDEALELAQAAVRASPTRGNYLDTLGMVQVARGDTAAARQSFEKALALEPGSVTIKRHLEQLPAATAAASAAAPSALPKVAAAVGGVAPVVLAVSAPVSALIDPAKTVGPALEAWRLAWVSKDASRYLASYAKGFVPADQISRSDWEADRRVKLAKKGDIQVTIAQAVFSTAGDAVVVNFEQRYQSSNYQDSTRKQIEWVREGDVWRIQREVQR